MAVGLVPMDRLTKAGLRQSAAGSSHQKVGWVSRRFALMRVLEAYSPLSDEERAHAEMLVLARSGNDVLSRYSFSPGHFTASGFVTSDSGRLLLVFHERLRKWLQPGGHIEPSDVDFLSAARREIIEETGLDDVEVMRDDLFDVDVHHIPAADGEPPHTHLDLRSSFARRENHRRVTASATRPGSRWVT